MIHSCVFCLVMVVHESLVVLTVKLLLSLRKILQLTQILWFSSIFVYLNPFQQWLNYFISIFSHRGQLRDSFVTITEDSNTHWCSRRRNHGAWKLLNRIKFAFLVTLPKYQLFSFSTALQKLQKILTCIPKEKTNNIYPDLQIQKVFSPRLLLTETIIVSQWHQKYHWFKWVLYAKWHLSHQTLIWTLFTNIRWRRWLFRPFNNIHL